MESLTPARFRIVFEVAAYAHRESPVYSVDSWITYAPWAKKKRLSHDRYDAAIVTVSYHIFDPLYNSNFYLYKDILLLSYS